MDTSGECRDLGYLSELVMRDIVSLQGLLEDVGEAETVYVPGQMRSAPVADLIRHILTMLGKRCILLDQDGGLSTYIARTITDCDLLMAASFRFYAKE